MKKTNIWFASSLILSATFCLLTSCSKDEDDDEKDPSRNVTITIENISSFRGQYLLENSWSVLSNNWKSDGYAFDLFIAQGAKIWSVGTKHSNENSLSDLKANLTVNVPINSQVDINSPYKIIAVDDYCGAKLENGAIVCDGDLKRGYHLRVHGWYVADMGNGYSSIAQSHYVTASEGLTIKNNTNKTIKVKHKGFDVKQKWYYTTANVKIVNTNGINTVVDGKDIGKEAISSEFEIAAKDKGFVVTRFVPTGKKMTDARLILEINGKEVKTEPASSDVMIENGIPYFLEVEWDGTNLTWNKEVW